MSTQDPCPGPGEKGLLLREAQFLHRLLFGTEAPPELTEHYAQAHQFIRLSGSDQHFMTVRTVIDLGLDAEAVELALRSRPGRHPLRQKMHILTYLAEADCRYYHLFINDTPSFAKALLILAAQVVRTAGKLVKGKLLVWRYALV